MLKYGDLVLNKFYRVLYNGTCQILPKNYYFIHDTSHTVYTINNNRGDVYIELYKNDLLIFEEVDFNEIQRFLPKTHPVYISNSRKNKIKKLFCL